jgi:hypothetical protein
MIMLSLALHSPIVLQTCFFLTTVRNDDLQLFIFPLLNSHIVCVHSHIQCLAGQNGRRALRSGFGEYALLGDVGGVCVDTNNDTVYFCDYTHHAVRAISPEGYVYTLVRGAGASAEEDAEAEETLPFPLRYAAGCSQS